MTHSRSANPRFPPSAPAVGSSQGQRDFKASGSDETLRLSKLMSQRGICSRREADEYIRRGWVYVNGRIVSELGVRVQLTDRVTLAKEALQEQKNLWTIVLNKPIGYVSSQPEKGYIPSVRLLTADHFWTDNQKEKAEVHRMLKKSGSLDGLAVSGRLDIDSQGLLLFTQDGRLAKKIIGQDSEIEKEYLVRVQGSLSEQDLRRLRFGLELDGRPLKSAQVEWINKDQLRFVLKEGRKRQIRRMCELVGLQVCGLKRVRVGGLKLGSLPEGYWRLVSSSELASSGL